MLTKIIENIRNTNTDNGKISIIKENSNNKEFLKLLDIVYNPKMNLGVTDFELPITQGSDILENTLYKIEMLADAKITGNAAVDFLIEWASDLDLENQLLLQKMIRKNLQCDLGIKTINKAIPNFIKKPPYMRCALLDEKTKTKIQFPAYVQEKCDGQFVNIIFSDDGIEFVSRTGTNYFFKRMFYTGNIPNNVVIMGELLYQVDGVIQPREIGNGIINKASEDNLTITERESNGIIVKAWDMVTLDEFNNRKSDTPYYERFEKLDMLLNDEYLKWITTVDTFTVNSFDEAGEYYKKLVSNDQEGIIIKNKYGKWADKTSQDQLKMKIKFQVELKVVGFNKGKPGTAFERILGSLACESADGKLKVDVGTGFKDDDRISIWEDRDNLVGKIVTVEGNKIIEKDGSYSIFLPVFVEFRNDKDTADDLDKILAQEKNSKLR